MGLAVQSGLYVEKIILLFFLPRCRDGSRVHNLIIANFMPSIVRLSFCELFVFVAVRSVFRHIGVCNRLGPCVEKIWFFCSFCKLRTEFLFVVSLWMHCVRECLCPIELYGYGDPVRFVHWENQTFLISLYYSVPGAFHLLFKKQTQTNYTGP